MEQQKKREADYIVIGSGPGGASVAYELAKNGKQVIILEEGKNHTKQGKVWNAASYIDGASFLYSKEGHTILRATTTGGSTLIYTGTCTPMSMEFQKRYNIDIEDEQKELIAELNISALPSGMLGESALRILGAANQLGFQWQPLLKFFDQDKMKDNKGNFFYGDVGGVKWTAREFINRAIQHGATLHTEVKAREILHHNGVVTGLMADDGGQLVTYLAKTIIVAGGGSKSPLILLRSGLEYAGDGLFCDPTKIIYGITPFRGSSDSPPMTVGTYEFHTPNKGGFILSQLIDPLPSFPIQMMKSRFANLFKTIHYRKIFGIMIKLTDTLTGRVNLDGTLSKPLTWMDKRRMDYAGAMSEKILLQLGALPRGLIHTGIRLTHFGGSCGIDRVVNRNLETEIKNLYVCDSSVIPASPGSPLVLMILALSRKLGKYLCGQLSIDEEAKKYGFLSFPIPVPTTNISLYTKSDKIETPQDEKAKKIEEEKEDDIPETTEPPKQDTKKSTTKKPRTRKKTTPKSKTSSTTKKETKDEGNTGSSKGKSSRRKKDLDDPSLFK